MTLDEFQKHCESFKSVRGDFPFDEKTLVYKVKEKMFVLTDFEDFKSFSVKCNPETAMVLREVYEAVSPGYHLNKKHWNTVKIDGSIDDETLKSWIEDSYNLVVKSLPKREREKIN